MKIDKYQSCENTFLITILDKKIDYSVLSKELCDKYDSDGMLVFKMDPMEMFVYNKDGTKALMCGNGIRCLTHFLYDKFKMYYHLKIKSGNDFYNCSICNIDPFVSEVSLGIGDFYEDIYKKEIEINNKKFTATAFLLGVPHIMIFSNDFKEDVQFLEKIFKLFDSSFNVSLVKVLNSYTFEILTYERGVGITKSCGTAAAACSYILYKEYDLDSNLVAISSGGVLRVNVESEIILKGESSFVERYNE